MARVEYTGDLGWTLMVTPTEDQLADDIAAELLPYLWETITVEEVSDVLKTLMEQGYTISRPNE